MEALFIALGFLFTWIAFLHILSEDNEGWVGAWVFVFVWWVATAGVWYAGNNMGEHSVVNRTDVLEYDRIVYSVPKTVIETKYEAPWWSVRDDKSYIVVKENK